MLVKHEAFETVSRDEDNRRIANSVMKKYNTRIEKDEMESIYLVALWGALKSYDHTKSKFSTHLFNAVKWECLNRIRERNKHGRELTGMDTPETTYYDDHSDITFNEMVAPLDDETAQMMKDKYQGELSLSKIGRLNNMSYESVRTRLKRGYDQMRTQSDGKI